MTWEDRVQVLKLTDTNVSSQIIAKDVGSCRTQVQYIIKDRENIMKAWKEGGQADKKYKKARKT